MRMGARPKSSSGQGPKRSGVGWVTVATAHARPPPARLLTRMRSVPASGLQGMGPTTLHSPASRRGRMSELPNFEPLGFSSRSCRSTGRLMRSLAPWWGEADLRLPPFFPAETRRVAAASAGFSGRGQDRSYVYRSYALEQRADYQTQLDSDLQ